MDLSRTDCVLARESVSADLDGELNELDSRRLQAHLRVCADCSAWANDVAAATTQLREAPLEALAGLAFELHPRRRTWRVGTALAAAPAAALVAAIAVFVGTAQHASPDRHTTSTPVNPADTNFGPVGQHRVFHAV